MGPVVVVHELHCSMVYGVLLDQGPNLCPLHWQAAPHPLGHQGSPSGCILKAGPLALLTLPRLPGQLYATPTALLTPLMLMSSIFISSVTNYCKFGGLKHHLFILIVLKFRRRQRHHTPVLLPGKSHGWRSLVGCSPWGPKSQTRLSDFTFTFHFHELEKETATHSSVLAWRIPGTGEPGGLLSMGSHRVGHG